MKSVAEVGGKKVASPLPPGPLSFVRNKGGWKDLWCWVQEATSRLHWSLGVCRDSITREKKPLVQIQPWSSPLVMLYKEART